MWWLGLLHFTEVIQLYKPVQFSHGASGVILLWLGLLHFTEASVHDYNGEKFVSKGNAFVVHGGSEGIYASTPNFTDSSSSSDSFIR